MMRERGRSEQREYNGAGTRRRGTSPKQVGAALIKLCALVGEDLQKKIESKQPKSLSPNRIDGLRAR
jgi:hypothetical protein